MDNVTILGIETSCDETAAAVVVNGRNVLSNVISSQVNLHKEYGGVVPEIASRKHVELIFPVIDQALQKAGLEISDINAVAVTYGPGLVGALLVGVSAAKAIAYALSKPLIGVNHIRGHIAANYIVYPYLEPPYICLVASGGHSHIVLAESYLSFKVLGRTRDDAAGEAFDKVARALELGYPGGPAVDSKAKNGDYKAINFPRVHFADNSYDFSFSGVKTAVINHINTLRQKGENIPVEDICASFQEAVTDVLVANTIKAAMDYQVNKVCIAGGVAANSSLRKKMQVASKKERIEMFYPPPVFCTDNAAMIASAAYYEYIEGNFKQLDLNAEPSLEVRGQFPGS